MDGLWEIPRDLWNYMHAGMFPEQNYTCRGAVKGIPEDVLKGTDTENRGGMGKYNRNERNEK